MAPTIPMQEIKDILHSRGLRLTKRDQGTHERFLRVTSPKRKIGPIGFMSEAELMAYCAGLVDAAQLTIQD